MQLLSYRYHFIHALVYLLLRLSIFISGHGRIVVRAKCHLEIISNTVKGINRSKNAIVITELPYMTNKAGITPYCTSRNQILLC